MKELLIMRHGKSDWSNTTLVDFDRPLKKRGRKDSLIIGEMLDKEALLPDVILCSTAERARQTLAGLQQVGLEHIHALFFGSFYYEGATAILDAIYALPGDLKRVLIIGHNPTMEELVAGVFNSNKYEIKMSTAAIAYIVSDENHWQDIKWSDAKLEWIRKPKDYK